MTLVFNALTPQECNALLLPKNPNSLRWLLRKSREPNMLTVTFALFYNNKQLTSGNVRYAKTDNGIVCASTKKLENVQPIDKEEDIAQLIQMIISNPLVYDNGTVVFRTPFLLEEQIKPELKKAEFIFPDK